MTASILQVRKLRQDKEVPICFPMTHMHAELHTSVCSDPHLYPWAMRATQLPPTHMHTHTHDQSHPVCAQGCTVCAQACVHTGCMLLDTSQRRREGAKKGPKSYFGLLPAPLKHCWQVCAGLGGWGADKWLQVPRAGMALYLKLTHKLPGEATFASPACVAEPH